MRLSSCCWMAVAMGQYCLPCQHVILCMCADIVSFQETKLSKKDLVELKDFAVAEGWSVLNSNIVLYVLHLLHVTCTTL